MNLDWAKRWLEEGFQSGLDDVMDMYAEGVEFEDPIFGVRARGKDELRQFFRGFFDRDAGVQTFQVKAYRGDTSAGAVEWVWRGEHTGELLGVSAAGKNTETQGVSVFTFEDGLVTSQRDYWNAAAVLRQLGALR